MNFITPRIENSFTVFLLDIGTPLRSLVHKQMDSVAFFTELEKVCEGSRFLRYEYGKRQWSDSIVRIVELTQQLLMHVDCRDCGCPNNFQDMPEKYDTLAADYVDAVLVCYTQMVPEFEAAISQCPVPGFLDDYASVMYAFRKDRDVAKAQAALAYWSGVISDEIMYTALITVLYAG